MAVQAIKPPGLRPGDRVAVVAPAGAVDRELLDRGLESLRGFGLQPVCSAHLFDQHFYMAGSDEARAADLQTAFRQPDIKAVFCARGGAGMLRLLPRLDPLVFRDRPKIFLASSDVTSFLLYLYQKCGVVAFHGPMVAGDFARGRVDPESFGQLFSGAQPQLVMNHPFEVLRPGRARGVLTGGCLSLIAAMEGTPYAVDAAGSILFLEDIAARPYQVERMLTQLKIAGKLQAARALLFGEMKQCQAPEGVAYTLSDLIRSVVDDLPVPVIMGFPSGHTTGMNRTLPLGVEASLDTAQGTLTIEEKPVE